MPKRAARKIYAEVLGYGMSGDAYHITAPSETGEGGERSMRAALKNAGLEPQAIDYINAHGTSTMADTIELSAVERFIGRCSLWCDHVIHQIIHWPFAGRGGRQLRRSSAFWPFAIRLPLRPSIWTTLRFRHRLIWHQMPR